MCLGMPRPFVHGRVEPMETHGAEAWNRCTGVWNRWNRYNLKNIHSSFLLNSTGSTGSTRLCTGSMPRLHVVPSVPSACAEAASVAEPKTAYKGEVALHQQAQGLQTRSMWNAPPKNQTVLAFKARRKQQTLGHGAAAKHFPARVLAARPVSRSSGRGLCGPPLSGDAARAIPLTREKRYYQNLDSCGLGV